MTARRLSRSNDFVRLTSAVESPLMDIEREYDAYDLESTGPAAIYVNRLNLVLVGQQIWLVDETSHTEIVQEVQRSLAASGDIVIWPLDRAQAAPFARYMDWDAVCAAFPDEHPIYVMPIPAMATTEVDRSDPRLGQFDLDAIRAAYAARGDQLAARPNRYHTPSFDIAVENMPPLD